MDKFCKRLKNKARLVMNSTKRPFINDVTQVGGKGVSGFVTLCMKVLVKYPF